jgi:hypothetical protein
MGEERLEHMLDHRKPRDWHAPEEISATLIRHQTGIALPSPPRAV